MKNKMKKLQQLKLQREIEEQRRREAEIDANPWDFSADWNVVASTDIVMEEIPEQMDIEITEQTNEDVSKQMREDDPEPGPEPIECEEISDVDTWGDLPEFPSNETVPGLDGDNGYDPKHPGWPAEEKGDIEIACAVSSIDINW